MKASKIRTNIMSLGFQTPSHISRRDLRSLPRHTFKGTFPARFERLLLVVTVHLLLVRTQHISTGAIDISTFLFTHIWLLLHSVCARQDVCTRLCRNEPHSGCLEGDKKYFCPWASSRQEVTCPELWEARVHPEGDSVRAWWCKAICGASNC